ncbi:MAG: amino acid adenylation domain-containing protein [Pseudomonadota bacterium]|nr:amino acid adenylation domain-containing protein [Pseudomonadota bacterium]
MEVQHHHILHAFDRVCSELPGKLAVQDATRSLSYAELSHESSALAGELHRRGVGPGDLVCILGQRSVDFVVAALAVWRCAAGYVPIADDTPAERIDYVVRDTRSRVVICLGACVADDPRYLSMASFDSASTIPLSIGVEHSGAEVAYVIYTSGSTGAPKGVVVGHDSLAAVLHAYCNYHGIASTDRVSAVANIGFDASVIEYWPALARGASVHVGSREILHSMDGLMRWLSTERITYSWLPTPIAEVLLTAEGLDFPDSLRRIETAGERLKARPGADWKIPLHNSYGPTEATVIATSSLVAATGARGPDIGRPLPGVHVHVLDGDGRPVPEGETGELFIGGIGVARGYLNQPGLTAARFVPDPFSEKPCARMYATGDLCRWNDSGNLEFIARNDGQVKIRGNRVELGEIEQAMMALCGIRQSICRMADQRLVGYYTRDPAVGVEEALEISLRRVLPSYMVPDVFIELTEVPLSANGKTDYEALPLPEKVEHVIDAALDVHQQAFLRWYRDTSGIALAWTDDFFRSGGNSVGAIMLLESLRRRDGVQLGLREFFNASSPCAVYDDLRAGPHGNEVPSVDIERRDVAQSALAPLSASQRSIWFMAGLHPDDRAYHAKAYVLFDGDLCATELRNALSDVVERHEVFRTTIKLVGDEPFQLIHPPFEVVLEEVDLTSVPSCDSARHLEQLLQGSINRPFDLDRLPLVRWALVRLAGQACALLHVEHHLVHDGWSYNLFLRDLVSSYSRRVDGVREADSAPTVLQYADYCVAQMAWLQNGQARASEDYWLNVLEGAPTRTNLPSNGVAGEDSGETIRVPFPRATWQKVQDFCRSRQCTAFAFVLGAFSHLLSRYSGDDDVCIGSAFANRSWGGADGIVGMVINTVVLRAAVAESDLVSDHLARCMQVCLDAQTHQAYPFERLVQLLNPTRVRGENPLFQVFMGFHDSPMPELAVPGGGKNIRVVEAVDSASSKFDLSLVVIPREGQEGEDDPVHMLWEFKHSRFAPWFVRRLIESFGHVVDSFLGSLDQPLANVRLEKPAICALDDGCPAPEPVRMPYDRIRQVAEMNPDRIAVRFKSESVSYLQLMDSVDKKAARLAGEGIGSGDLVGICLPRSVDMLAWMLAAQRAGAAYVPIDPGYPPARISFILDHCRPGIVVRDSSGPEGTAATAAQAGATGDFIPQAHDPAYVIYTSGSTGNPKGVVVDHGNLSAFLDAMTTLFPLCEEDRWCAVTSASFDISILECWLPLCTGAMLVLADEDEARDAGRIAALLSTHAVNHLQATPSTWRALLDTSWAPSEGRFVGLCGGEAMPGSLASALLARGVVLYNMYGPTETTIWSCVHAVQAGQVVDGSIPIGKPIAGTHVVVLDAQMQPVPLGAMGELWIGGAGVSQGYLNDPVQTAERFHQRPELSGGRLYKTGDIASLDIVGDLHFHGRSDGQVKIRGYRIELAEVEATLAGAPGLSRCAVSVVERGESRFLVAHVVMGPDGDCDTIKAHCAKALPGYMVPDIWVALESLPLTPNGKIDRAALGEPVIELRPEAAPRTATEADLEQLYAALLDIERVDIRKGFYAIGGHSLLAMRLVARINRAYTTDISVTEFLRLDSIQSVAAHLDDVRGNAQFLEIFI